MALYSKVKSVEEATHWQPTEKRYEDDIMLGKPYELVVSKVFGDKCIIDEVGIESTCYLWNEGNFVKLEAQ